MSKKLKIGYLTSSISSAGGWDSYSKGVVKSLSKITNVIVLTRENSVNDEVNGINIIKTLPKKDNSYNFLIQIKVFFKTIKYLRNCDVIHSLIEPYAPGAALASFFLRIPFFLTFHGTYAIPPKGYSLKNIAKRNLMRMMYSIASIVTTGAERNAKFIQEVIQLGEYRFIPNGVDPDIFYRINVPKPDKPFVLTVGEVKPRKGADVTIQALIKLKDEFPDLEYNIVGKTTSAPGFIQHLQKLASDGGIESRVKLLGKVSMDELRKLYNQCSIFILAAQTIDGAFEGFPMVFYEAQACGAPLISTYGFGSEYVIKNGYNGYLVHEGNSNELTDAIKKILENPDLRSNMIANSLKEADLNTWDKISLKILEMYNDGLNKK